MERASGRGGRPPGDLWCHHLADAEQALERLPTAGTPSANHQPKLARRLGAAIFFDYPPAIRRAIYTTNAIESLNYSLRKVLKSRGAFPNDESIIKLLYMGLQHVAKKVDAAHSGVESCPQSVRDSVWGAGAGVKTVTQLT